MEDKIVNHDKQVDNVLKSVSDEILAKKKRKRIITFSIISAVCLALAITVITMSVVKINLTPYFIKSPNKIEITVENHTSTFIKDDDEYNNVNKLLGNSYTTNYLTALFAGETSYSIKESTDKFYSSFSGGTGTGMSSTLKNKLGNNYGHFQFDEIQTLYSSNHRAYTSVNNSEDLKIEFVDVYFNINSSDSWEEITFYFGSCTNLANRIFSITISGNNYGVYNYVNNL